MLHERSRPVHELAAVFDISRPAISRHLKVLKDAGLVTEEKAGRENVYSLQRAQMKPMEDWLEKHRAARPAKKAAKPKAIAEVIAAAPEISVPEPVAVMVEPVVPVVEPVVPVVEPVAAVAEVPVAEPVVAVAEPVAAEPVTDAPAKPKRAPKAPRPSVVTPPAAPQLSFFDL